jgi:hypothetical protein
MSDKSRHSTPGDGNTERHHAPPLVPAVEAALYLETGEWELRAEGQIRNEGGARLIHLVERAYASEQPQLDPLIRACVEKVAEGGLRHPDGQWTAALAQVYRDGGSAALEAVDQALTCWPDPVERVARLRPFLGEPINAWVRRLEGERRALSSGSAQLNEMLRDGTLACVWMYWGSWIPFRPPPQVVIGWRGELTVEKVVRGLVLAPVSTLAEARFNPRRGRGLFPRNLVACAVCSG